MSYPFNGASYPGAYPYYMQPYQQAQPAIQQIPSASYQNQQPQQQSQPVPQPQAPQMQNGGFAFVRSEQEARDYPVAPGNYMTFKDEHAPYLYEKSKSYSQLDEPTFEKYRLIKEEAKAPQEMPAQAPLAAENGAHSVSPDELAALTDEVGSLRAELDALQSELDGLKRQLREPAEKKSAPRKGG